MLRIVAYDIADPRRLRAMAKACLDYGIRAEKSVFECRLETEAFEAMWKRLVEIADPETDALVAYPVCQGCERAIRTYGLPLHAEASSVYVF